MTENPYQSPRESRADDGVLRPEHPRLRRTLVGLSVFFLGALMVSVGDGLSSPPPAWRGTLWIGATLMAFDVWLLLWAIAMSVGLVRVPFTRKYENRRKQPW